MSPGHGQFAIICVSRSIEFADAPPFPQKLEGGTSMFRLEKVHEMEAACLGMRCCAAGVDGG